MPRIHILNRVVATGARLRSFAAGAALGVVARALFERRDFGWLPPVMGVVVLLCGAAAIVCFALDAAPLRDRAALGAAGRRVVIAVGLGILAALHLPGLGS